MRTLLSIEGEIDPTRIIPILYYGGLSISADTIHDQVLQRYEETSRPRLTEVKS